ncbi:hypothetical protein ACQEU8_19870 [Streptomyces sp. CA-250714]|uniref:hypothetical protein n=1 Tax=Streptomyces sp. CA-250714 TaxID=3240060 RepID=UPI003D89C9D9
MPRQLRQRRTRPAGPAPGAGAPLLAGTDATPFVPAHGTGLHRELQLFTEAGLSTEEALVAATSVPPHTTSASPTAAASPPGLRADLVLVEGDPTVCIAVTGCIADVWRRGVRQTR